MGVCSAVECNSIKITQKIGDNTNNDTSDCSCHSTSTVSIAGYTSDSCHDEDMVTSNECLTKLSKDKTDSSNTEYEYSIVAKESF